MENHYKAKVILRHSHSMALSHKLVDYPGGNEWLYIRIHEYYWDNRQYHAVYFAALYAYLRIVLDCW